MPQKVRNALTLTLVHTWLGLLLYYVKTKVPFFSFLEKISTSIYETILHAADFSQPCRVGTKHKPGAAPIFKKSSCV